MPACLVYRVVNDLQAEETAQHAVHRNAPDAEASAHDLQQQVDRLQQELAKSERRAERDHVSLTAKACFGDLCSVSTSCYTVCQHSV